MALPVILAMEAAHRDGIALTFDDLLLKTGHSETLPIGVNLSTRFSRNVTMNIPIASASMDTVTESPMGVEMAIRGGLGILHRNMSDEQLLHHFHRVKFHLSGKIAKPITVTEDMPVAEVAHLREEKGYGFHTFPVMARDGKLVGVISKSDLEFCDDNSRTVSEIMTREPLHGKPDMTAQQAYDTMRQTKKKFLPLVDDNGRLVAMYVWGDVARIVRGESATYNLDRENRLRVGISIGVRDDIEKFLAKFVADGLDVAVLESAHADTSNMIGTLKRIKHAFPSLDVVVGNVSEDDSALRLADAGADGIKVGQGGGSICTTRVVAGVGRPQISAVYGCVRALERGNHDIPVCSDGGIRYSGDIAKAIGAGASSVMLGQMLAATDEAPGSIEVHDGKRFKSYRGMGSEAALKAHQSSRDRYMQGRQEKSVPEGVEGLVPYRGAVGNIIDLCTGGLRSGMGYVGAANIQELREKGDFNRITAAGIRESHPHDILLAKEPPNYSAGGKR